MTKVNWKDSVKEILDNIDIERSYFYNLGWEYNDGKPYITFSGSFQDLDLPSCYNVMGRLYKNYLVIDSIVMDSVVDKILFSSPIKIKVENLEFVTILKETFKQKISYLN